MDQKKGDWLCKKVMDIKKQKLIFGLTCFCVLSTLWITHIRFSFQFQTFEATTRIPPLPPPPPSLEPSNPTSLDPSNPPKPLEPSVPSVPSNQPDYEQFKQALSLTNSLQRTSNCPTYFQSLKSTIFQANFKDGPVEFTYPPEESAAAKIAYSYVVHDYPGQFEILLHLTFRPYNSYCIYLDYKANDTVKKAFHSLIDCYRTHFPDTTIFMYPHPAEVYWAHYSLLNADLRCLEGLYHSNDKWDYYANLAGTELPVTSVESLAEKLANAKINISVESTFVDPMIEKRWEFALETITRNGSVMNLIQSDQKLPPPPYKLQPFKGMKNAFLSREFAHFALHHEISQQFRVWLSFTQAPDMAYFATLSRIQTIKETGQHQFELHLTQDLQEKREKNLNDLFLYPNGLCPRYSYFMHKKDEQSKTCFGQIRRFLCVFSMEDLNIYFNNRFQQCYVINRFLLDVDARPIQFLAKLLSSFKLPNPRNTYT